MSRIHPLIRRAATREANTLCCHGIKLLYVLPVKCGRGLRLLLPARAVAGLLLCLLPTCAPARVLSYSPVTQKFAYPALQFRAAPHFILIEQEPILFPQFLHRDRLVIHSPDPGIDPRVVLGDDSPRSLLSAAAWEDAAGTLRLLVLATSNPPSGIADPGARFLYSADAGAHWTETTIPAAALPAFLGDTDLGGPVVRGFHQAVRLGNREVPFIVSTPDIAVPGGVYAVRADGSARLIVNGRAKLLGTSVDGSLLLAQPLTGAAPAPIVIVDVASGERTLVGSAPATSLLEGWITPEGGVYLLDLAAGASSLAFISATGSSVAAAAAPATKPGEFFAVPTVDYEGAWIVQRGRGLPTTLSLHTPGSGLVTQWQDAASPPVVALHAAASGRRVLIQVDRNHPASVRRLLETRVDPGIAVWMVGTGPPPPSAYHELFLTQGSLAGFVHLDVDETAAGGFFAYCSGTPVPQGSGVAPSGGAGGGGDIAQEFGTVRSSLRQRLVLPGAARIEGRNGSLWRTDLLVRNPSSRATAVSVRFTPAADAGRVSAVTLSPGEIRRIDDVIAWLGIERGTGALFLGSDGEDGIEAAGYLYNQTPAGRFGTHLPAVDQTTAAGARFPVTFAAASTGTGARSNLVSANPIDRPSSGDLVFGFGVRAPFSIEPSGQAVLPMSDASAAATVESSSGQLLSAILAVDDKTNDPTLYSPDLLPAAQGRVVPVILHGDGLDGTSWRTDLFFFNPAPTPSRVSLSAVPWSDPAAHVDRYLEMGPGESRRVEDALQSLFGMSGTATLLCESDETRITSRVWSPASGGGTIGLAMPPLNSFQIAAAGEALEILVPLGSSRRINLALVDVGGPDAQPPIARGRPAVPPPRRVVVALDDGSGPFLPFTVEVPQGGGIQVNDLLTDHPLRPDAGGVLIRLSPSAGLIGAFAVRVESGTHDPASFPAILAAQ